MPLGSNFKTAKIGKDCRLQIADFRIFDIEFCAELLVFSTIGLCFYNISKRFKKKSVPIRFICVIRVPFLFKEALQ
jgi:hypothetical protein